MKKIVVFNTTVGSSNLGDEIICRSLWEQLDFLFRDSFVMQFGTHVRNFDRRKYYLGDPKLDFAGEADYKIIMGTNMLSRDIRKTRSQWPVGRLDCMLYQNSILAGAGTTLEEGMITPYSEKIYEKILRRDMFHSVRDEVSKNMLEHMGFRALNTGCPTLWNMTPSFCQQIPAGKADRVVFSLSGYDNQKDPGADRRLLQILKKNYKQLYFWCQTSVDESYLDCFDGVKAIPRIGSLDSYQELLRQGNIDYIGTRLHGGVFALQHRVRSIVIAIDGRARGFHETNRLPICERTQMEQHLESMLQNAFHTEISLPQKEIEQWKHQFQTDHPENAPERTEVPLRIRMVREAKRIAKTLGKKYN